MKSKTASAPRTTKRGAVASPSDLEQISEGRRLAVGGRVMHSDPQHLILADYRAAIRIRLKERLQFSPGDYVLALIEAEGSAQDRVWYWIESLEHCRHPEPTQEGEFFRLQQDHRGRSLVLRDRALRVVREYFQSEQFVEVETPSFATCPGLDAHVASLASVEQDGRKDYLITSPEFHMKRLLSGGMPRIFQFARCYRAEEKGSAHEPEFTLLEWYRSFSDFEEILQDTEEIVSRVFAALGSGMEYPEGKLLRPFERMTMREAFSRYCGGYDPILLAEADVEAYFRMLVEEVEPGLAALGRPVFLTHYPLSQAALARQSPSDPSVAERFELYVGALELSNGYGELTDPLLQRMRFLREQERRHSAGEPVYPIDEAFMEALKQGLPPCSGNALGFDRLVALALGLPNIQQGMAFSDAER